MNQRVAVVGLGYWGPRLLRNLVEHLGSNRVVAVDSNIDRIAAATRSYPDISFTLDLETALATGDIGAVVIATPLESHAALATAALDAGCHVLVEKPLAASTVEAVALAEKAASSGLVLMVGHTFLFSPRVAAIRAVVENGDLGRIHYITSSRLNLGLHRRDANVIWDLGPHDFSILFHVLGEFPVSVQTSARGVVDPTLPDVAFINLEFASGAIASVALSWLAPRKVRNTTVVGDARMLVYDDTQNDEPIKIYNKGIEVPDSPSFGEHQLTYRYGDTIAPHVPATEPLSLQLAHFFECIEGAPGLSDGWLGVRIVEALETAHRSWEEGGVPVLCRAVADSGV